jgi:hypothetical protein
MFHPKTGVLDDTVLRRSAEAVATTTPLPVQENSTDNTKQFLKLHPFM